jgi:hypothetical protein
VYAIAVWFLWDTVFVWPVQMFVVLLHELSHGLVAIATGGTIREIGLSPDQGGFCRCPGGNAFLTLSAGYLGSLAWGALFIEVGRSGGRTSRVLLGLLGAGILALGLLTVRSGFAIFLCLAAGAALVLAAFRLEAQGRKLLLTALGLTSCLYAVLDIKSDILDRPGLPSDATALARMTGIPALVWGLAWITASLIVCAWLLRRAWSRT